MPRTRTCKLALLPALSWLALGAGCEIKSSATDWQAQAKESERLSGEDRELFRMTEAQRARQAVADKYRDRIEPGVGCEVCPEQCTWLDLRAIEPAEYRRAFRKWVFSGRLNELYIPTSELYTRIIEIYEFDRLTCLPRAHKSMRDVLVPLHSDRGEHPLVRFHAAHVALNDGFHAGDPAASLYLLSMESNPSAKLARALIQYWDEKGWPKPE